VIVEATAQELGCTVRAVWRDLGVLEEAGSPIYDEPGAKGALVLIDRMRDNTGVRAIGS
jgi:predicted DNA-binding transcriptional regulator YafY